MLISYRHGFLFIHIPKTAGTSIRHALAPYRWGGWVTPLMRVVSLIDRSTRPMHRLALRFPRHGKAVAAQEMLPEEVFASLTKFAVVRNPWDRLVSAYHHLERERPGVVAGLDGFAAFVEATLGGEPPATFHQRVVREPQARYLCGLDGALIVDRVLRCEHLAEEFPALCRELGIGAPALSHRRRATHRADYRRYYDEALAERVAEHYADDLARFGYRFD